MRARARDEAGVNAGEATLRGLALTLARSGAESSGDAYVEL
jgi:hypothetical protein